MQRQQLLRQFPQFTSVQEDTLNRGSSTFHMLAARFEKRFSGGLSLLANYQWSKLIEWRSHLNPFQDFLEKRIAAEDRPRRLVLSASYDLPFGLAASSLLAPIRRSTTSSAVGSPTSSTPLSLVVPSIGAM